MKTVRLFIVAALCISGAAPATAQTSAPTFKSGADLVRFDVSVADAAGRPITDLRQDEIEVQEGGHRRPVVLFQRIVEPAGAYADAAIQAVTAQVTSNEAFPRGHQYIFIFDQQRHRRGTMISARVWRQKSSSAHVSAHRIASRCSRFRAPARSCDSRRI